MDRMLSNGLLMNNEIFNLTTNVEGRISMSEEGRPTGIKFDHGRTVANRIAVYHAMIVIFTLVKIRTDSMSSEEPLKSRNSVSSR
ncbi:hypothetical protein CEXT_376661 [Caerostris extrusa]|uniref:Uncharacterized protein n=1 Tax=Caerostris extrusa TaxID=172846 RepID=A0AAV4NTR9_CAEEX|nr:hypothetical protein CEXT_376661 [Caerostris extrusa]